MKHVAGCSLCLYSIINCLFTLFVTSVDSVDLNSANGDDLGNLFNGLASLMGGEGGNCEFKCKNGKIMFVYNQNPEVHVIHILRVRLQAGKGGIQIISLGSIKRNNNKNDDSNDDNDDKNNNNNNNNNNKNKINK